MQGHTIGTTIHDEVVEVVRKRGSKWALLLDGRQIGYQESFAAVCIRGCRLVPGHRRTY